MSNPMCKWSLSNIFEAKNCKNLGFQECAYFDLFSKSAELSLFYLNFDNLKHLKTHLRHMSCHIVPELKIILPYSEFILYSTLMGEPWKS